MPCGWSFEPVGWGRPLGGMVEGARVRVARERERPRSTAPADGPAPRSDSVRRVQNHLSAGRLAHS